MSEIKYKLMSYPPTEEMAKAGGEAIYFAALDHENDPGNKKLSTACYQANWEAAPTHTGETPGISIPEDIQEWIWHLELHLTEHDTHHAGLALRAAYPAVRDFFTSVRTSLIQVNNRCKELEKERNAALAKLEGKK